MRKIGWLYLVIGISGMGIIIFGYVIETQWIMTLGVLTYPFLLAGPRLLKRKT